EFSFNFPIYNKSCDTLSLSAAEDYIQSEISPLMPEAFILHLGENDTELFAKSQENFDNLYLSLIESIKNGAKNTRVAIVSVKNPTNDPTITSINAHIKAISEAEACTFINLENAKLWNPNATKAANDFAYSMGLNIRKPLKNVAEILYSYAHKELELPDTQVQFAG
ncbi:SGNH/GDSL hydrolase family protein, partial [bacterium]|nr:SGNH/GDSL hydrolase family protein [bacterium]